VVTLTLLPTTTPVQPPQQKETTTTTKKKKKQVSPQQPVLSSSPPAHHPQSSALPITPTNLPTWAASEKATTMPVTSVDSIGNKAQEQLATGVTATASQKQKKSTTKKQKAEPVGGGDNSVPAMAAMPLDQPIATETPKKKKKKNNGASLVDVTDQVVPTTVHASTIETPLHVAAPTSIGKKQKSKKATSATPSATPSAEANAVTTEAAETTTMTMKPTKQQKTKISKTQGVVPSASVVWPEETVDSAVPVDFTSAWKAAVSKTKNAPVTPAMGARTDDAIRAYPLGGAVATPYGMATVAFMTPTSASTPARVWLHADADDDDNLD